MVRLKSRGILPNEHGNYFTNSAISGSSRLKTKTPYSSLKNKAYNSLSQMVTFLLTFTFPFGKLNS